MTSTKQVKSQTRVRKQVTRKPPRRVAGLERLHSLLGVLLDSNCQAYSWYPLLRGHVRAKAWARVWSWLERASTEVYGSAEEHFAIAQIHAVVKKSPISWVTLGLDMPPEERAVETYKRAEQQCARTNRRFSHSRWVRSKAYRHIIGDAQLWIERVIGCEPDLARIYDLCDITGGAALGVHGNRTNLFRKFFSESWTCTPGALAYAASALLRNEQLFLALCPSRDGYGCWDPEGARQQIYGKVQLVQSNKLGFVPKTAKTSRSIAVEPLLNSFIQKGIDQYMRLCLRRYGQDLRDQSRNQRLAREGSIRGNLATVDLSSASDTMSTELVKTLLPPAWFDLLNSCRSPSYEYCTDQVRYNKFVSMGNGFCFPLQTLIFTALARACVSSCEEKRVSVYGDDIILSVEALDLFQRVLRFCGFTPNPDKTFGSGSFRESCGADWFAGLDVRPVYLEDWLVGTTSLMIFHNATLRSDRVALFFQEARPLLRKWCKPVERFLRPFELVGYNVIPHGVDAVVQRNFNGAFSVPYDEFIGSKWAQWNRDEQRWSWMEFQFRPRRDLSTRPCFTLAQYWAFLRGSPGGELHLRYATTRLVVWK